MTNKFDTYRQELRNLNDWDSYLLQESNLPGPRGNLELAHAVAQEGTSEQFQHWMSYGPDTAPTNSPYEFLAFCGVLGQGTLLAQGQMDALDRLRSFASDPRWRIRESVAQALQFWGKADMKALLAAMKHWSSGSPLEQRAAAAGLCEPSLLAAPEHTEKVLRLLDGITESIDMLLKYVDPLEIEGLLAALRELEQNPDNTQCLKRVADAFNELGFVQGQVLVYAPYINFLLSGGDAEREQAGSEK